MSRLPAGLIARNLERAGRRIVRKRKTKVQSWYLDLSMIEKYWGSERVYHHTAPISMNYALHEALRIGARRRFGKNLAAPQASA